MVGNCVFVAPVVIGSRKLLLLCCEKIRETLATCAFSGGVVRRLRTR